MKSICIGIIGVFVSFVSYSDAAKALIENPLDSEQNIVKPSSNLVPIQSLFHSKSGILLWAQGGEQVQSTITTGLGTDYASATTNAIENALKQLAGSVVSSETFLEKRTKIVDGIVSKAKEIRSEIHDFSQGSIKSVDILKSESSNDLFYVTAKVSVRLEDFRVFVRQLANAERKIDQGLFSQIATNRNNLISKSLLIKDRLNSIANGEVQDIEIGKAFEISNEFKDYYFGSGIAIPIKVSIKDDSFQNILQTIRNASAARYSQIVSKGGAHISYSRWWNKEYLRSRGYSDDDISDGQSILFDIPVGQNRKVVRFFIPKMREFFEKPDYKIPKVPLKIEFRDASGSIIVSDVFEEGSRHGRSRSGIMLVYPRKKHIEMFSLSPNLHGFNTRTFSLLERISSQIEITQSKLVYILFDPSSSQISKIKSVKVTFDQ